MQAVVCNVENPDDLNLAELFSKVLNITYLTAINLKKYVFS